MKSGSASIERQEETQAPHWMQAIDWVMSIIDSGSTTYSRSGGSPCGSSQGVTRRILVQCVDSMSVIRSLITGMFPIGSTTIGLEPPLRLFAASCASPIWVLQPRPDWPLTFIPQEPQIAARQEQRTASEPSSRSLACSRPSRTESEGSRSTLNSSQYGPSPLSGWNLRTLIVYSAISKSSLPVPTW